MRMKIIILGASFDNYNLGVGALATGIVTSITEAFPDADISLLTFSRESTTHIFERDGRQVPVRIANLRMKPFFANNALLLIAIAAVSRLIPLRRLRNRLMLKNPVLACVHESDFAVSIAGGDSFSDIYGLPRLLSVLIPKVLVLLLRKPLILLPQTIGPFDSMVSRALGRLTMEYSTLVYCRDRQSLNLAEQMLRQRSSISKARFCYDVAFVMKPATPGKIDIAGMTLDDDNRTELVGVNISGLLSAGGYKRNDALGSRDKYIDQTFRVVELLLQKGDVRILLIPHTLGTGLESDSNVCEMVYEELSKLYPGRIGVVRGWYSAPEMKYIIGRCRFFIGARMHACIAALSQGIPAVAFSYSRKFAGVLETIGISLLALDAKQMSTEEVLNAVEHCFESRLDIRRGLEMRLPQVRNTVLDLFREIEASLAQT